MQAKHAREIKYGIALTSIFDYFNQTCLKHCTYGHVLESFVIKVLKLN